MDGIKLTLILLIDPTPFGQLRNNLRALAVLATSVKSINTVCNDKSDCYADCKHRSAENDYMVLRTSRGEQMDII